MKNPTLEALTPVRWLVIGAILPLIAAVQVKAQQEPPALNPFGTPSERPDQRRDDAVPGFVETSDGKVHSGQVFLTRDARLKIYDESQKKHREIPLKAIKRIDCTILKEWVEKEWRFKENASDEKYFTGRTYPSREYSHKITLRNGQTSRERSRRSSTSARSQPRRPNDSCCTSATRGSRGPTSTR